MENSLELLADDKLGVEAAREAVWRVLEGHAGFRDVYAALCRWTWRVTVERRLDDDLRSWHRLLLDTSVKLARGSAPDEPTQTRARLQPGAAAERVRALADVVRLSIDAAAASIPAEIGRRAHVLEILRLLSGTVQDHIERDQIRKSVGLGDANLSRVLTLLAVNGLVERLPRGKVASFRITRRGLDLVTSPDPEERERARTEMPASPRISRPETEQSKAPTFIPSTIVRLGGGDRSGQRDRTGPDHEPTYTPPKVIREWVGGSGVRARATRVEEMECVP